MAEDSGQSRTEAATPRRREEARRKGQVAYSSDLSTSFTLVVALAALWFGSPFVGSQLMQMMRADLLGAGQRDLQSADVGTFVASLVTNNFIATGMVVGFSLAAALLIGMSQAGMTFNFQPLSPNWERLNPVSGWSNLFSLKSTMRAGMAVFKASIVVATAVTIFRSDLAEWTRQTSLVGAVGVAWYAALKLAITVAIFLLALAAFDYLFQRNRFEEDLKMTRQEIIEERRDDEGDPHLRARMRRLQRDAMQNRTLAAVPNATVVVSNPTHFAVALRYERGRTAAPIVVAKGADAFARRIIRTAEEHGVPVLRRPPVARALYALSDVDEPIPEPLFQAVAEILAFVYATKRGE